MRNVELKARLHDRTKAEEVCRALGAAYEGNIRQRDTYFAVREGRLKLRESDPGDDYLVFYRRPDVAGARGCDYEIAVVDRAADRAAGRVLGAALGVLAVIEKLRTLYLWENVRVHLDEVERLGSFIEFEAVLSEKHDDADGFAKLARLQEAFGIRSEDLLETSYLELMLERPCSG